MMRSKLLAAILLLFSLPAFTQEKPLTFSFEKDTLSASEFNLRIKAGIPKGVKLFSTKKISEDLPVNTVIEFDTAQKKYLVDSLQEKGAAKSAAFPDINNAQITYYTDSVEWVQKVKVNPGDSIRLKGTVTYWFTSDKTEGPQNNAEEISRQFQYISNYTKADKAAAEGNSGTKKGSRSLGGILLAGLLAGLIAFLTPCIYSMVPVTVNIFLKQSKTPAQGRKNAFLYAASIVAIYTIVGILVSTILPEKYLNQLSTNWLFNFIIFVLFLVFGISFLGAFEIALPSSWANAAEKRKSFGSISGIFFGALALVIVSFSCTGNFVAWILGEAFRVNKFAPTVGMFAFGLGLALPFALFALIPSLLKELTKAGGWQNALKVTLGFLEIALAMKFLSNADVAKGWGLLNRDIYLAIWIGLFILLGLYLLGKFRLKHDSSLPRNDFEVTYTPLPRMFLSLLSFAFAIYLIPGLWGAPLNKVSGLLPPLGTQEYILIPGSQQTSPATPVAGSSAAQPPEKHIKFLKKFEPYAAIKSGMTIYYDYEEAMAAAKALKKPLMIDFTGINCPNCREFESKIWVNDGVSNRMKNDFVVASLFEDYEEELRDEEKHYSELLGARVSTVGDKYKELSKQLTGGISQPNYIFLGLDGKKLIEEGYGYDATKGPSDFITHLEKAKAEFAKRHP